MSEKSYDSDFDPENEGECRKTHVGREENVGKAQRAPFNINKKMRLSSIQEVPRVKSKVQHNRPSTSTVTNMSESDSDDAVSAKATQSGFNYDLSVLPEGSRTIPDNFKHVSTLHKGLTLARKRLERHAIPYFNLPSTSKDMNPSVSGLLSARKKNIPVTYNKVACNQYCNTKKMKEDKFVQISSKIMLSNNQPISDKSQKQYLENEIQIYLHKTHLLCLVAHGLYVNSVVIRSRKVFRYIYAQMPPDLKVNVSMTISHIKKMLNWFGHRYKICRDTPVSGTITKNHLESLFLGGVHKQKKYSLKDLVMLFVLLLRGMGLSARFVMSLQPVPLKPKKTNEDISDCGSKCKPETAITILEDINKPGPSGTQKLKTKMLKEKVKYENQKDNDLPVSSDSENEYEANILNGGIDYWIEVFIREEDKWISVDVYSLEIDCPREIYARCTKPAMYVVGWKNDNFLKEVTKRYVPMWHITSDVRVGKYWFEKSLRPFLIKDKRLEAYEEAQLDDCVSEINDPIPNKVTELKYHPYYTLERYLSKFECIYRNAVPLGYIKGEPVYSRDSIQEHLTPVDRMQERIKVSQQPYKILRKSMVDTCCTCEELNVKIKSKFLNDVAKRVVVAEKIVHLRRAKKFYNQIEDVTNFVRSDLSGRTGAICIDYMQNLDLPRIPVQETFYLRQLTVNVFCIHNLKDNKATFVVYHEGVGGKGPNEVCTFLYQYLKRNMNGVESLHLFSDACGGQNRNHTMIRMLSSLISSKMFKDIKQYFPIRGHSFLPCDRDFAVLKRKLRKYDRIFTVKEVAGILLSASTSNKFEVMLPSTKDIIDFKQWWPKHYKKNMLSVNSARKNIPKDQKISFKISQYHFFHYFAEQDGIVTTREYIDGFISHSFALRNSSRAALQLPTMPAYTGKRPINKRKMEDLKKLEKYLPQDRKIKRFYKHIFKWPVCDRENTQE